MFQAAALKLLACTCVLHGLTAYALQIAESKTISDDELVQYLVRRKARKISQT